MKKKVLFMLINMNIGGTEKALLNILQELSIERYEITILMLEKYGEFLNYIPDGVQIKYLKEYRKIKDDLNLPPLKNVINNFKGKRFVKALNLLFFYLFSKFIKDHRMYFKYLLNAVPELKTEYDIAVAYAGPMDFISYFVAKKIKSKKKIQWIHFDITKIGFNKKFASKIYEKFDKIFVVSNEGKNKLGSILPKYKYKTDIFLNILSSRLLVEMAEKGTGFEDGFSGVRILTVGRLSKEKGQDLLIPILAKLKKDGFNIKWYCIGEGSARLEFEGRIKEYSVENDFILLGKKPNPYPFFKQCDIYVQPSLHEGYCITLSEAKCFHKPIISTNFTGAKEQITHNKTGLIVNDNVQLYEAIKQLMTNEKLREELTKNLQKETMDTTYEIEKLHKIAESTENATCIS